MDIGTAKPTIEEMLGVRHHMIDTVPPWEKYYVARYVEDASKCVDDIIRRGKQPIVVGGTGLYIESLLIGREFSVRGASELRRTLESQYDNIGGEAMLIKLREVDADSAKKLHANDKKRIIRAFETFKTSGKPISQHDIESKERTPRYSAVKFALMFAKRDALYARITNRVDKMMSKGLKNEVISLLEMNVSREGTSMQAIGYKEIADAIKYRSDIDEAVEKIKMESRRYAKRQLTWLRRDSDIRWLTWESEPDIDRGVVEIIKTM